ncbi:MAG: adenylate/guanylate cyclase domain-containing protein [Xenococcaceae cyanobacterium]
MTKNTRKANILVIDDSQTNLHILAWILTQQRYVVRTMSEAKFALAEAREEPPDLILLDIKMPGMDGYEVCEQLKADERTRDIPVIFISALNLALDKVQAFSVGGVDYITKPFQHQEVLARVENQLTIRELQKQLQEQNALLRQEQEKLRQEQEKSESLLLNILPKPIAAQLKEKQRVIAEEFNEVTLLFADIADFTRLCTSMTAKELVELLNQIFSNFDQLAERYGLEKIKTIGDAYMVVGGLPVPRSDHAEAIAQMALEMREAITRFQTNEGEPFQIRIGINTGPVIAGVIGIKKFIYDLWGDTVNVANRMQSQGLPGSIQVTPATYERLQDKYLFEERGTINVKGKGEMTTYWLMGSK